MNHGCKIAFVLIWLIAGAVSVVQAQIPCPCRIPRDPGFQIAPMTQGPDVGTPPLYENNNAATPAIPLPFSFCFYGQSYDSVFICNNGIVSFKQAIYRFDTAHGFPYGADTLMIAPFNADVDTRQGRGAVYYKVMPSRLIVLWDSVEYSGIDVDGWDNFQLILTDGQDSILPAGNNVSFCYPVMQWSCSDSSGGFSGYGGVPAIIGINKGDGVNFVQIDNISKPGNVFFGPFSPDNGIDWLDGRGFTMNTCVNGNNLAPIISDYTAAKSTLYICPCDTTSSEKALGSTVQACDTVSITAAFMCTEPGQAAIMSYSCAGPMYIYSVDTSTVNFIDSITVTIIPAYSDSGTQVLTFTATDPVTLLQSVVTYTIVVTTNCLADTPVNPPPWGITGIGANNGLSIYPNPATNMCRLKYAGTLNVTDLKLYDVVGEELYTGKISSGISDIDMSHLAKGIYFVRLFREGNPIEGVAKLIVQ